MANIRRFWTIYGSVAIVLLAIGCLIYQVAPKQTVSTLFDQKELIIDEAQFIVTPVLTETKEQVKLIMSVQITSFMNGDIFNMDALNQMLLETTESLVSPVHWEQTEKSKYQMKGTIVFDLVKPIRIFKLKIFTFSDYEIDWG